MDILFSLIVPVYNVLKYLDACIDSIMQQDFPTEQFEVICVDDGSTDGSSERLDYLKQKYDNLQVIHQKNRGVAAARNAGIAQSHGEYLWFVDSDDLIASDALSCIHSQIQRFSKPDRLKFSTWVCYDTITYEECCAVRKNQQIPNIDYGNCTVINCVFRRKFILDNAIRFNPSLTYAEDIVFVMTVLSYNPSNFETKDILYFHRLNPSSLMFSRDEEHTRKRIDSEIEAAKQFRQLMTVRSNFQSSYREDLEKRFGYAIIQALSRIQDLKNESEKKYLKEMHASHLFPCKIRPDCIEKGLFSGRSHAKLFYYLYCHLNNRWGYYTMKILKNIAAVNRGLIAKGQQNKDNKNV